MNIRKALVVVLGVAACSREGASTLARSRTDASLLGSAMVSKEAAAQPVHSARKIIRDLDVRMQVKDVDVFLRALDEMARASGGYVADRDVSRQDNGGRSGSVTVRLAAGKVDGTGEALHALGKVESESLKAEDISEQYYDLAARIHSAQLLETRLSELLSQKAGKLTEIMEVEAKLASVRENIEQLQGKQRRWDDQVELATIRIAFHVDALPPVVAASFGSELFEAARSSTLVLLAVGRSAAVVGAALLPWSPIVIGLLVVRQIRRRRRATLE
jgi:hypothetical protein